MSYLWSWQNSLQPISTVHALILCCCGFIRGKVNELSVKLKGELTFMLFAFKKLFIVLVSALS